MTKPPEADNNERKDVIWGGKAIADELGVKLSEFYYLLKIGALNGAVRKFGHRKLAGSRKKLQSLVSGAD